MKHHPDQDVAGNRRSVRQAPPRRVVSSWVVAFIDGSRNEKPRHAGLWIVKIGDGRPLVAARAGAA